MNTTNTPDHNKVEDQRVEAPPLRKRRYSPSNRTLKPEINSRIETRQPDGRPCPKRVRYAKTPGDSRLKILQLNMGKKKVVNNEIRRALIEREYDIALVQEPHAWKGCIPGMGLDIGVVTGAGGNETPAAAVLYPSIGATVTKVTQLCTSHCVCVQMSGEFGSIYLVSIYFQFKDPIGTHLKELEAVLTALKGQQILIAVDVNAKSFLWTRRKRSRNGVLYNGT